MVAIFHDIMSNATILVKIFERITKSCIAAYIIIGAHLVECISTSQSCVRVLRRYTFQFVYHEYDYRPNWTRRSPITNFECDWFVELSDNK